MVIRRGGVTDIAWVFAGLEMKCLITNQHVTGLLAPSYHSLVFRQATKQNLGSVAQGTLELYVLQFGRCNFWSDPCLFGCILRKSAYRDISHII